MITFEQLEKILDETESFRTKDIDHNFVAIKLLREKIPYEKMRDVIQGASHDVIYFCDVSVALEYLSEEDAIILGECNVMIDEDGDCLAMFV